MFDKWFKAPVHFYLHLIALSILAVGVSTSNVLMSIGTIWLIANWLLEGNFEEKWIRFKHERIIWVIGLFFLYGIISLLWSDNLDYGLHDLRIKLPVIVIPLVLSTTKPLEKKYFYFIIYLFLGSLLVTSIWNFVQYTIHEFEVYDIRQMSRFISHVRFSILINLGIFFTYYIWLKRRFSGFILFPIIIWFIFYQYKSQVVNGYGLFVILSILSLTYWLYHLNNKKLKRLLGTVTGVAVAVCMGTIIYAWQKPPAEIPKVDFSELDLYTANNNGYYHQKNTNITEDGKLVYLYISEKECRKAWVSRASIHFDSLDRKGNKIAGTLYRYMTSKDLRKDSIGFLSLTDNDIHNIENGFSNYKINRGIIEKINDLKMQLFLMKSNGDPNGNSLIQRKLHLLAAGSVLKDNWLGGVGIGDVQQAFDEQYEKDHSMLKMENRHRSHNQFLTVWISHGLIGFILLLLLWFLPFFKYLKTCDYLLCTVLIAFGFSFLWQDMLETQAGVTIFALFYSLMVFKSGKENVTYR